GGDYHQHREHVEQDSFKFHNQPEVGSSNQHGDRTAGHPIAIHPTPCRKPCTTLPGCPVFRRATRQHRSTVGGVSRT
ncbi:hypothetical protein ACMWQB_31785, partial [Escherichia coli]|uniref:hypothetical protein n=1 Tax=Escherichia coli TaxID=562 RepID=UPI0039E1B01E